IGAPSSGIIWPRRRQAPHPVAPLSGRARWVNASFRRRLPTLLPSKEAFMQRIYEQCCSALVWMSIPRRSSPACAPPATDVSVRRKSALRDDAARVAAPGRLAPAGGLHERRHGEKTISLTALALVIVSPAKAQSRVRRLRRFLANPHICVRAYYD